MQEPNEKLDPVDRKKISKLGKGKGEFARNILKVGAESATAAQGLGIGAATSIFTLLSLVGVTTEVLISTVASVSFAGLVGGVALGVSTYLAIKRNKIIKTLHGQIEKKVDDLKPKLIEALEAYRKVQLSIDLLQQERALAQINADRKNDIDKDINRLENYKKQIIQMIRLFVSISVGALPTQQLLYLLDIDVSDLPLIQENKDLGPDTQNEEARKKLKAAIDQPKLNSTIKAVLKQLDQEEPSQDLATSFNESIIKRKDLDVQFPGAMSVAGVAVGAVGGFFTGFGLTLTIAAFVVGGFAAATGIGWPLAVAAVGAGLVLGAITLGYGYYVERKQSQTLTKLNTVNRQLGGANSFLHDKVSQISKLNKMQRKSFERDQRSTLSNIRERIEEYTQECGMLEKEFKNHNSHSNSEKHPEEFFRRKRKLIAGLEADITRLDLVHQTFIDRDEDLGKAAEEVKEELNTVLDRINHAANHYRENSFYSQLKLSASGDVKVTRAKELKIVASVLPDLPKTEVEKEEDNSQPLYKNA